MSLRLLPLALCVLGVGCATAGPATKPRAGTPASSASQFDPNSAENTLSWLAGLGAEYFRVEGNPEATDAVQEKMGRECAAQRGKEISWGATIEGVSGGGVSLKPMCQPLDYDVTVAYLKGAAITSAPRNMFPAYLLVLQPVREDPDSTEPFNVPPDSWALKRKPGTKVIVTGNVARLLSTPVTQNGIRYMVFRVSIEDHQFQPVE